MSHETIGAGRAYAGALAAVANSHTAPPPPPKDDISSALKSLDLNIEELGQLANRAQTIANLIGAPPADLEPIGPSPEPRGVLGSLSTGVTAFARLNSVLSLRLDQNERAIG